MFLQELTASIDHIKGAGPAAVRSLARIGITDAAALLRYYPRDWEDRTLTVLLKDFRNFPAVCTEVRVLAHDWFGFGRMKTLKVHIEDESARAVLVCFNRPFLEKQLVIGNRYRLWGRFYYKYGEIQSSAFEFAQLSENTGDRVNPVSVPAAGIGAKTGFGRILPVYPLSAGITQGMLRRLMQRALAQYAGPLENELPQYIIQKEGLLPKAQAIRAIHFPQSMEELGRARTSLIYEELFYLEIMVGRRALERRNLRQNQSAQGASKPGTEDRQAAIAQTATDVPDICYSPLQNRLIERLPFRLTGGQSKAIGEINRDMAGSYPMARLLQGDVGSGKTLVSFMAALGAVENGGQAAIMAPTELLARQHAENAARLLEPLGIHIAFLTGNVKAGGRNQLLKALGSGDVDIAVGTHALFSRDVVYRDLRLVVVDEQHRFGVVQRSAIMAKGDHPDLLMMSATPIPRTLALTVFGDLDVSVIQDLPPGRKPVKTHLAKQSNERKVYDFVKNELASGRQAYFVYPLIENDEDKGLKDAESMARRIADHIFPEYRTALIHSRLDDETKRNTMNEFRRGDIRILVATSVVEVGVDVPNASVMVIEHAERFGLSALHQLRGRVGRGEFQSYCFLVYSDELTEDGKTRLKVMLEHNDGFVIAEEDLKLRGPGQIAGTEQSGYLVLGIADPVRDIQELSRARMAAFSILENDPGFLTMENRVVGEVIKQMPVFLEDLNY
ncbi:ATP-dependent DNA helicase RecG [Treponema sp. OttesenSCG-928-L16]|nr:ATP-dependent DNA helicase RecG [Treponema sp. OttesenSCG-928-L16]